MQLYADQQVRLNSEWNRVEDGLSTVGKEYNVAYPGGLVSSAFFEKDGFIDCDLDITFPSHWKELPSPPQV